MSPPSSWWKNNPSKKTSVKAGDKLSQKIEIFTTTAVRTSNPT
jgi:hypothetical protein